MENFSKLTIREGMSENQKIGNRISPKILSGMSHDELVSQLMKAYDKIEELETVNSIHIIECLGSDNSFNNSSNVLNNDPDSFSMDQNLDEDHLWEETSREVIQELQSKFRKHTNFADSFVYRASRKSEDFVVAYEHKGDFPCCDEDLTFEVSEEDIQSPKIVIEDGMWDEDDDDSSTDEFDGSADEVEEFPLIPSPVLNTPPYEYIFLTKENEAKFRIFLNPKLNKVFQEELAKLRVQDDRHKHLHISPPLPNLDQNFMDVHNQNHLVDSSYSEIEPLPLHENTLSTSNVIHCFDPSDVDLELKKIFTEKPPITHKIVRRRTRKERGSSVPAVDSYYGTRDLNKVGHASYFIPMLTESERKAIGWKSDYHYGHWKYANFTLPNVRTNPISLHPHPHPEEEGKKGCISRHHHSYHHCRNQSHHHHTRPLLSQNPLHQKEINLSEAAFILGSEAQSLLESPASPMDRNQTLKNPRDAEDPLSFITLSGAASDANSTSCHIIPDSCALKRILRWLLPTCAKAQDAGDTSSLIPTNYSDGACGRDKDFEERTDGLNQSSVKKAEKKNHEIETLVEPSSRLAFPASDTNVSFASLAAKDGRKEKTNNSNCEQHPPPAHLKNTSPDSEHHHSHHHHSHSQHQSHHHHHHHNHHGFFHWKHILNHGTTLKSDESMSVVGGDVVDSGNESSTGGVGAIQLLDIVPEDVAESREKNKWTFDDYSSQSSDTDNVTQSNDAKGKQGTNFGRKRKGKKLKSCKAFEKLLTLKDLGYETEEDNSAIEIELCDSGSHDDIDTDTEQVDWSCPILI